ncbi:MAG: DedA family protein [Pirellulales bacterium]
MFRELLSWILHLDQHLGDAISWLGPWFYGLVFGVVFCETGLVITPFLPGDSFLFALGALAGSQPEDLNILILFPLLIVAAIAGDAVNYGVGRYIGPKIFSRDTGWLMNKAHLIRAQKFYEKHGGKAIILARFLPIVRTFAPFVAGIGEMNYGKFWIYNTIGGIAWVTLFLLGGYLFSNVEIVRKNFSLVILAIVLLSFLPVAYEWWKERKLRQTASE